MELYFILGFVLISALGSLFHFVFKWSGNNKVVGFFTAVNESTWEHLKLAFFPTFIWTIVGLFLGLNNFALAVFVALATIKAVIVTFFYTYTFFTKKSILFLDIFSFFLAVGLSMYFAYLITSAAQFAPVFNIIGIVGTALFALTFALFTIFPPKHFMFIDPITKQYGFPKQPTDKK